MRLDITLGKKEKYNGLIGGEYFERKGEVYIVANFDGVDCRLICLTDGSCWNEENVAEMKYENNVLLIKYSLFDEFEKFTRIKDVNINLKGGK